MKAWREAVNELLDTSFIPADQITDGLGDGGIPLDNIIYRRNDPIPGVVEIARVGGIEPIVGACAWVGRPNRLYLRTGRSALPRHLYDAIRDMMSHKERNSPIYWRPSEADDDWARGWEVWVRR